MFTHHAYYIEDSLAQFDAYKDCIHAEEKFSDSDPNFVARVYQTFSIDDARALIELSSLKNTGTRALFFLGIASMTHEAQQALLKLFEEPQVGTTFVLLVPHGTLLATLKSRLLEYPYAVEVRLLQGSLASTTAPDFLGWTYKVRSEWIASLIKDEDTAREKVRSFLNELEGELYKKIGESREIRESLDEIAHFRQYLSDRSPSLKMILEHFAATLPQMK